MAVACYYNLGSKECPPPPNAPVAYYRINTEYVTTYTSLWLGFIQGIALYQDLTTKKFKAVHLGAINHERAMTKNNMRNSDFVNIFLNTHFTKDQGPVVLLIARHSRARGPGFDTRSGHILLFLLPLKQEGQLSVTGESLCTKYWLTVMRSKPAQDKCG